MNAAISWERRFAKAAPLQLPTWRTCSRSGRWGLPSAVSLRKITDLPAPGQSEPEKPSSPHDHSRSVSLSKSNSDSNSDPEPKDTGKEVDYYGQIHHYYEPLAPSPPPPSNSAWDFLNFFDTCERYDRLFAHKEEVPQVEPLAVKKKTKGREKLKDAAEKA